MSVGLRLRNSDLILPPHFTDGKTETRKDVTCSRSQIKPDLKARMGQRVYVSQFSLIIRGYKFYRPCTETIYK